MWNKHLVDKLKILGADMYAIRTVKYLGFEAYKSDKLIIGEDKVINSLWVTDQVLKYIKENRQLEYSIINNSTLNGDSIDVRGIVDDMIVGRHNTIGADIELVAFMSSRSAPFISFYERAIDYILGIHNICSCLKKLKGKFNGNKAEVELTQDRSNWINTYSEFIITGKDNKEIYRLNNVELLKVDVLNRAIIYRDNKSKRDSGSAILHYVVENGYITNVSA